jgi:hypothetical protein
MGSGRSTSVNDDVIGRLLLLLSLLGLIACQVSNRSAAIKPVYIRVAPESLAPGDVICRYAAGPWSDLFRNFSLRDPRFSHVGIVLLSSDGVEVIHASADDATGQGLVKREALSAFLEPAVTVAVFRHRDAQIIGTQVALNALTQEGRPFDARFDLGCQDAFYCSELVWWAYNRALPQPIIGSTWSCGLNIIAIDDCYPSEHFSQIFDSERAIE